MIKAEKSFLDNISVTKKSFLLLLISTVGILFLGALSHVGLYSIKSEIDQCYDNDLRRINDLHDIYTIFNIELQTHLQHIKHEKDTPSHHILNIQETSRHAFVAWNRLKQHHPAYAKILASEYLTIEKTLKETIVLLENPKDDILYKVVVPKYEQSILTLNQKLSQLFVQNSIKTEIKRANINEHYHMTLLVIALFILLLLTIAALLSISIYGNIKKHIFNLSDIVTRKTKDYQELALQLEYKVNKEVIKNREKDQIMYQHARLAAMGEMIGNIAHQWRQPLNALTILIQSFGIKSMGGNLTQAFIDQQVNEGLRLANQMSTTIEDFKNFFSPHKDREYFGARASLKETLELVEFFCKDEHIDIQLIAKEEVRVYGYSNEFAQVILNFLNNARDNFKQKNIQKDRKIIIKLEKKLQPEPYAMISFVDNGGGINSDIIDRIFEPYFTTKHKSTGTGIGLYMSKQIIEKQMHGLVTVKNITHKLGTDQVYKCAQFIIAIPLK